jgi:hypothetical protein
MRSATDGKRLSPLASRLSLAAAILCAGCGNYGNLTLDDAPFVNALPRASDLKYAVPQGNGQPVCLLGESKVAVDTRSFAVGLAASLDAILALIDLVRAVPATERTASQRTWGPWPDQRHPGIWDRVVMQKLDDTPRWSFQLDQRAGTTGDWLTILSAQFVGAQAKDGQGTMHLDWTAMHTLGTSAANDPQAGAIDIEYTLAGDPRTIHGATTGTVQALDVTVAIYADGQLRFDLDFTDANGAHITATSKFASSGAGRASYAVSSGIFGDTITECWDALYCRSYIDDPAGWLRPPCTTAFCQLGAISTCPAVH